MLEVGVPAQFEAQAQEIIALRAQGITGSDNRYTIIEGLLESMKDTATTKLSTYVVEYKQDGTSSVSPIEPVNRDNPMFIDSLLTDEGKTVMIGNDKGFTMCLAPINVNGRTYLHTFRAEDAQTLREELAAQLTAPKEPSRYDRFCNWCAETFLRRPGKVVGAYKEQKAFYDSMKNAVDNMTGIPGKVDEYKQGKEEQKRLEEERIENERLEKERLEKERLEKERIEKERIEAERKAEEETKKRQAEELKRQMEEANKKLLAEQEQLKQQENEKNQYAIRAKMIKEIEERLPKNETALKEMTNIHGNILKANAKQEADLERLKASLATDEKTLVLDTKNVENLSKQATELTNQLKEQEVLREYNVQKQAAAKKMEAALKERSEIETQLKAARADKERCWTEWAEVAPKGSFYNQSVEEYLKADYEKARAEREEQYKEQRKQLEEELARTQEQIDIYKGRVKQIEDGTNPLFGRWGTTGAQLDGLRDKLKQATNDYKALVKQGDEKQKAFEKAEEQFKKEALNPSAERRKSVEDFLNAGKADHLAKFNAKNAAERKVDQLSDVWDKHDTAYRTAKAEYDKWNKEMNGKSYDKQTHDDMMLRKDALYEELTKKAAFVKFMKADLKERRDDILQRENDLRQPRADLKQLDEKIKTLQSRIPGDKSVLTKLKELQEKSPYHKQAQSAAPSQPQVSPSKSKGGLTK